MNAIVELDSDDKHRTSVDTHDRTKRTPGTTSAKFTTTTTTTPPPLKEWLELDAQHQPEQRPVPGARNVYDTDEARPRNRMGPGFIRTSKLVTCPDDWRRSSGQGGVSWRV